MANMSIEKIRFQYGMYKNRMIKADYEFLTVPFQEFKEAMEQT